MDGGVYLYPDPNDTDHTCLSYQEVPNDMNLSETMVDIALLFSSKEAITAMVEGALTSSGITGFTLSPVDIEKTKLNGFTCYRGASTVTLEGETGEAISGTYGDMEFEGGVAELTMKHGDTLTASGLPASVILQDFEPGRSYTEQEVNFKILDHYDDYCTVRRELVDFGLLIREKGRYVRPKEE